MTCHIFSLVKNQGDNDASEQTECTWKIYTLQNKEHGRIIEGLGVPKQNLEL